MLIVGHNTEIPAYCCYNVRIISSH